jgi:hypothetical protein
MKVLLYFDISGIHEERNTEKSSFDLNDYPEFNSFTDYSNYLVLYNKESIELSCVKLPFTEDKFNGSILIVKLNKNKKIITFPISNYLSLLNTKNVKYENFSSDSSDDEDPFTSSCNLQKTEC